MRSLILGATLASLILTAGCAGMSPREQRVLSGGAIGAAGGAAIGALTGGSPVVGALIGGAGGALIRQGSRHRLFLALVTGQSVPRLAPDLTEARGAMFLPCCETTLNLCLDLLRGSHTRVTLFAVEPPSDNPAEVEAAIGAALTPLGRVGRLPDGRIGLVYLGPHGHDDTGREALHAYVSERISRRLLDRGWECRLGSVRIAAVDRWTDGVRGARDLIDALPPCRARPRDSNTGAFRRH